MTGSNSLTNLKVGQRARVTALRSDGSMRRRLQDIGLIAGTEVAVSYTHLSEPLSSQLGEFTVVQSPQV